MFHPECPSGSLASGRQQTLTPHTRLVPWMGEAEQMAMQAIMGPEDKWRLHGFGLLQFDLGDGFRVHVWDSLLRQFSPEESIHNHAFNMTSFVVRGSVCHAEVAVTPDEEGDFKMVEFHMNEGGGVSILRLDGYFRCRDFPSVISAGSAYSFPKGIFHGFSVKGMAVTVIRMTEHNGRSSALFPKHSEPRHRGDGGTLQDLRDSLARARACMSETNVGGAS